MMLPKPWYLILLDVVSMLSVGRFVYLVILSYVNVKI